MFMKVCLGDGKIRILRIRKPLPNVRAPDSFCQGFAHTNAKRSKLGVPGLVEGLKHLCIFEVNRIYINIQ